MKVRIETTLILTDLEVKAARMAFEELRDGDETFRDFIKSSAEAYAHYWQQQCWSNYLGDGLRYE
jgi:hypothetical protein